MQPMSVPLASMERENSILSDKKLYEACPFHHQVGGHSPVVSLVGTKMIAKPVDSEYKEFRFYQKLPKSLLPFVPTCHGLAPVKFSYPESPKDFSYDGRNSASEEINKKLKKAAKKVDVNPWSVEMFKKQISSSPEQSVKVNCILMENLVERFHCPSILDIKIGTRTYRDDMAADKKERKLAKDKRTTTGSLGFRINGLQVYNHKKKSYEYEDKYHGQILTPATVSESLGKFFKLDTGSIPHVCDISKNTINAFMKRLKKLKDVIETQKGLRFYSSSLLLIYEGNQDREPMIDVKIIDFANTQVSSKKKGECDSPDEGFLFGLDNLSRKFAELLQPNKEGNSTQLADKNTDL